MNWLEKALSAWPKNAPSKKEQREKEYKEREAADYAAAVKRAEEEKLRHTKEYVVKQKFCANCGAEMVWMPDAGQIIKFDPQTGLPQPIREYFGCDKWTPDDQNHTRSIYKRLGDYYEINNDGLVHYSSSVPLAYGTNPYYATMSYTGLSPTKATYFTAPRTGYYPMGVTTGYGTYWDHLSLVQEIRR